ncbi:MAG: DUF3187 family protein [Gemmatimonadetes bacterium]|nr:DUF3187 family protein [Gemmatimonadota bacterium]
MAADSLGLPADSILQQVADPFRRSGPLGPLPVAERNPLYHLFLTPTVEGTAVLDAGAWRVEIATAYSNIFEYNFSDTFEQRFDLERSSTVLAVSRGLGTGLEVGASLGIQHNWGGFLDPAIQGIHDLFGLPNADREKVANGQYGLYLGARRGPVRAYVDLPPGTGLEAPRLWAAWRLLGDADSRGALTVRGRVKLAAGDHRASSRRTDGSLEVAARRSWGPTHVHLSAGIVRFRLPTALEAIMRDGAWFGSVAVERQFGDRLSLIGQFFGGSRYAAGFGFAELDRYPVNLTFGAAGRMGRGWSWHLGFTEDVPPNSPSVDFTVDLGLSRTWSPG